MRGAAILVAIGLSFPACGDDGGSSSTIDARRPDSAVNTIDAAGPSFDGGSAVIPETRPSPLPSGAPSLTAVTYNAGLIAVVKGRNERMPLIVNALKALDADVICLQEIYSGTIEPPAFHAMLADTYPNAYWTWTGAYPQRTGLLIVSKHPLYRGRELYYTMGNDGPTVDRAAIGVTMVASNDAWYANVLCTHWHAGLANASDLAVRSNHADELKTWATNEGYLSEPSILLGDFNAGPAWPSAPACECGTMTSTCDNPCDPWDAASYNKIAADWTDPFDGADFVTSGREQFLHLAVVPGLFPDEPSQRIDHCFHRGLTGSSFYGGGLALDEMQSISAGGETLEYLSDHYAVTCTFRPDGTADGGL